jgi:hypothetical protein
VKGMRSWRGKCEITSHERGYQPVDAAPARVQDYSRVARKEAICDRELLLSLSALEWCSVSCWGRGRRDSNTKIIRKSPSGSSKKNLVFLPPLPRFVVK